MQSSKWATVLVLASFLWCAAGLGFGISFGTNYGDQTCGLGYGEPEFLTNFKCHHFIMEESLHLVDKLFDDMAARRTVEGRDPNFEVVSFWEEGEISKRIRLYSSHNEYKRALQAGVREPDSGGGNLQCMVGIPGISTAKVPELDRNAFSHFGLNDGLTANFQYLEPFARKAAEYTYVDKTNPESLVEGLRRLKAVDPETDWMAPWLMSTSRGPNPAARRIAEMMIAVASEYLHQAEFSGGLDDGDSVQVCVKYHKLNARSEMEETRVPWCHRKDHFLEALRRIGWALHYLGDFFVPMHALGKGAEDYTSKHVEFEKWAESWARQLPHHPGYILEHGKRGDLNLDLFSTDGCKALLCSSEHVDDSYRESCELLCEAPDTNFKGSPYNYLRWAKGISGPLWKHFKNLPGYPGAFKFPTYAEALSLQNAIIAFEKNGGERREKNLLKATSMHKMRGSEMEMNSGAELRQDDERSLSSASRLSSEFDLLGDEHDDELSYSESDEKDTFYEAQTFPGEKYPESPLELTRELSNDLRASAEDTENNVNIDDIVRIMAGRLGEWPDPSPTGKVATELGQMLIKGAMVSTGEAFTDVFKQMRNPHQTPVVDVTVEELDLDVTNSDLIPEWFNDRAHYRSIPSQGLLTGVYNSLFSSTGASRRIGTPIRAVLKSIPSRKLTDGCEKVSKSRFWREEGDTGINSEGVRKTGSIQEGVRRMHPNAFNANNWSMTMSWPHFEDDGVLCNEHPDLAQFQLHLEDGDGNPITVPIFFELNVGSMDFGTSMKLSSGQVFLCNWRKSPRGGYDGQGDVESQSVRPLPNNRAHGSLCEEHEASQKILDDMNRQCGVMQPPYEYGLEKRMFVVATPATETASSWLNEATLRFTVQVRNSQRFYSINRVKNY